MIVAALELYVEVRRSQSKVPPSDARAVLGALLREPRPRNELVLAGIRASSGGADVVLCPAWTLVGRLPRASLAAAARKATVVLETVDGGGETASVWALRRGTATPLPAQVFERSGELDDADEAVAAPLAAAVKGARALPEGVVLVGGEINIVRREPRGGRIEYGWDPGVAAAGLPSTALTGKVVLNPSRVPVGSYIRDKRRHGPWAALVSVANRLDSRRIGGRNFAPPAHVVARGADVAPVGEDVLPDGESRVVWYELP